MIDANSQFFAILTNVGLAKQANADALGIPWKITDMGLGDANLAGVADPPNPVPSPSQTKLINEWRRRPLNQLKIDPANPAIIIAEQIIPADEGGRWIREIGLYDDAGDLVAVANCAPSYKPLLSQGSGRTQVVRMNFIVNNAGNITLKIDPAVVLASRAYVDAAILEVLPANKTAGEFTRVKVNNRGVVASGDNPATLAEMGIGDAFTKVETQNVVASAVAIPLVSVAATKSLVAADLGLVLIDAAAAAVTVTLPASNAGLGVREVVLRRVDVTVNALVIAAAGTDKILLDTTAQAAGQASTELLFAGDFLRLRSDGAGKWWCVGQADLPGSIATGFTPIGATGVSTYTVPPVLRSGRRWAKVKVTGAGGGGACRTVSPGPAGGAGGGVAEKRINLAGVATVTVTVGVGGQGGGGDGQNGSAGGATSFGGYCSGPGGSGGAFNGNSPSGSTGSGGDLNYSIGNGCPAVSGPGGSIFGGFGGGAMSSIAVADNAAPFKAGYGGGGRVVTVGAPGANGLVEISW
ncbi:MAG: phage tail protein [Pseudomonas sp.]|uniref:phage tail protein n=1 Tax=Pseudomonas sp. TaxID=306 RepID=UPI003D6F9517